MVLAAGRGQTVGVSSAAAYARYKLTVVTRDRQLARHSLQMQRDLTSVKFSVVADRVTLGLEIEGEEQILAISKAFVQDQEWKFEKLFRACLSAS